MAYLNEIVSISGTESDFIKGFVEKLTAADSRITCETDIDAEFANEDTSHIVTVVLNVNNCYTLTFKRVSALNGTASLYTVIPTVNGTAYTGTSLYFMSGSANVSSIATRTWKFTAVSNDNVIAILFGEYNTRVPTAYSANYISYHDTDFNAVASGLAVSAFKSEFLRTDSANQGESYTAVNRLNYPRDENIEIIESKVLTKGSTAMYDMKNIYDCSTVSAGNVLLIDGNKYFAIDTNTLIKIGA